MRAPEIELRQILFVTGLGNAVVFAVIENGKFLGPRLEVFDENVPGIFQPVDMTDFVAIVRGDRNLDPFPRKDQLMMISVSK